MNELTIDQLYEQGLQRYEAGEALETLLPFFKELSDRAPKSPAVWSSIAWLYLLMDKSDRAVRAAQKSVKLDPNMPQARVNLAIALLDSGQKGVRDHVERARDLLEIDNEVRDAVFQNLEDGQKRKPGWKSLERVMSWLSE